MVYANIEYLSRSGKWRSVATWAFVDGVLLIGAVANLLDGKYPCEWRMRVRY